MRREVEQACIKSGKYNTAALVPLQALDVPLYPHPHAEINSLQALDVPFKPAAFKPAAAATHYTRRKLPSSHNNTPDIHCRRLMSPFFPATLQEGH